MGFVRHTHTQLFLKTSIMAGIHHILNYLNI